MAINLYDIKKCEACGAKNVKGAVACSLFGAYSGAWCEDCLRSGRDSYDQMVSYIADVGMWPDEINEAFQIEVRRQLILHGKSEEEFATDVEKEIMFFKDAPLPTYVIPGIDLTEEF